MVISYEITRSVRFCLSYDPLQWLFIALKKTLFQYMSEWVNSGLTSHKQQGHTEMGPLFEASSIGLEKQRTDLAIPGLVV